MPLFQIVQQSLTSVGQTNFDLEKTLQSLVERNLGVVFNSRFVASEFPTGPQHGGRIDTLALSEDDNPVIIEYKKKESSELITQSLFYLAWIQDHRGDFEIAAQAALGSDVAVDWSDIRVICIAPNYRKYDLHAAQVIGANIELWAYRLFENHSFYLEEVLQRSSPVSASTSSGGKNPVMVEAGKKAAATRATGSYTFEQHLEGKPEQIREFALQLQEFALGLDPSMEESPKKFYVAYRTSQNVVCMELRKKHILLYLKLDPKEVEGPPEISRDMTNIGHYGTGDLEISIKTAAHLDAALPYIEKAYQRVGG